MDRDFLSPPTQRLVRVSEKFFLQFLPPLLTASLTSLNLIVGIKAFSHEAPNQWVPDIGALVRFKAESLNASPPS